jgi:antitoxin PrlF
MILEKNEGDACCTSNNMPMGQCCKVESVISIDDRGQMVLPKEIRDKAKIHAGDKLAVVSWEKDGEVCCISLIKVSDLAEMVKDMLGPVMSEIFQK